MKSTGLPKSTGTTALRSSSQDQLGPLFSSIIFIIAALFLSGIALLMGIAALASLFTTGEVKVEQTVLFVAFGFEGIVLLPAVFFSLQKFLQKRSADRETSLSISSWWILLLAIVAGASLLIGYLIGDISALNWILLPILTIPAVALPLAALLVFGGRKLPLGTRWQAWNVFGLAMTLAPLLLFTAEGLILLFVLIGIAFYIAMRPELASDLRTIAQQMMMLGRESAATQDLLLPFLTKPGVIVLVLIYIAVLVPLVEEIFKPLGVWLFARKLDSPAQGFTLGALSGGGYALLETLNVSSQTDGWAILLTSRIGTGLLHITTSALMGAAIVLAWRERRYVRLAGTYFLAVLLHGSWNALAVFFSYSGLTEVFGHEESLNTIQLALTITMTVLAVGLFVILIVSNRRLRTRIAPSLIQPVVPNEGVNVSESV